MKKAVRFSNEVQQEDIGLCESVQKDLRSVTYERGRYSVSERTACITFGGRYKNSLSVPEERRSAGIYPLR
jgi:hypothetical protein